MPDSDAAVQPSDLQNLAGTVSGLCLCALLHSALFLIESTGDLYLLSAGGNADLRHAP
ncbi:hypothetical protein D3C73_1594380 [compost metagenome]